MLMFAEAEMILPTGPHKGSRFRCDRQPVSRLWFDAVDSGQWRRFVATGPTQAGKTLNCFVIPLMYHLFEIGETVIMFAPTAEIAADKWRQDLLPAIKASRYRDLLPTGGAGSRGGAIDSIEFRNGATLKFMSGGGDDKGRAAFTSRVVVITETDGMDEAGGSSDEADKISQVEGRTKAFDQAARIYMECTVSTAIGRTWREIKAGSDSRVAVPCPACKEYVTLEREHVIGWKGVDNINEAKRNASLCCAKCGSVWNEDERHEAHRRAVLVHGAQVVSSDGSITGTPPETDTLGFRWNGANNMLMRIATIAGEEFRGSQDPDPDNAERKLCQQIWAIPPKVEKFDAVEIDRAKVITRQGEERRGIVPAWATTLTLGIDIGKYTIHWTALASAPGARGQILDYNTFQVPSASMPVEDAIMASLREMREGFIAAGWPNSAGEMVEVDAVLVDSGNWAPVIYQFTKESGEKFIPSKGFGSGQYQKNYYAPPKLSDRIGMIGEAFHVARQPADNVWLLEANVDYWKRRCHSSLVGPIGGNGSMVLFKTNPQDHGPFISMILAEKEVEEFIAGKGMVRKFVPVRSQNHFLDSTVMAMIAANLCGITLLEKPKTTAPMVREPDQQAAGLTGLDGRSFVAAFR